MSKRTRFFRILAPTACLAAALTMSAGQIRTPRSPSRIPVVRPVPNFSIPHVEGEILVKFKDEAPVALRAAALAVNEARAVDRIPKIDVYVVRIPAEVSVEDMVYAFERNPSVLYAEPNYLHRALATPNDTLFKYQYALSNTGQTIGTVPGSPQGKASSDIKAPQAWEETKGDIETVIAIVDSGVDFLHPDIKNVVKNTGKDFVNDDFDATDDFYHGTAVAGAAAAETDNNEGIAGVAWNARILPVKVLDKTGTGPTSLVASGVRWAADNGAQVINLSLGSEGPSLALRDALQYAFEKGIVIVAAAGNNGGAVLYPAAYDNYVLAVAATDYNDLRWANSSAGAEIDVAAPGIRVLTTVPTWYFGSSSLPYAYVDGTSGSSALVAGLAALIKSLKPWLTPSEIMDIIRYSADDINATTYAGKDEFIGHGRINMEKALVPLKVTAKK